MPARDNILDRLQKYAEGGDCASLPDLGDERLFLDHPSGEDPDNLIAVFEERFTAVNGEYYFSRTLEETSNLIIKLIDVTNSDELIFNQTQLIHDVFLSTESGATLLAAVTETSSAKVTSSKFSDYAIGVTSADYLIARTGSVITRCTHSSGRRLIVFPPRKLFHRLTLVSTLQTQSICPPTNDATLHARDRQSSPGPRCVVCFRESVGLARSHR